MKRTNVFRGAFRVIILVGVILGAGMRLVLQTNVRTSY